MRVRLALESRQRAGEEHTWIEAEEEARLVENERLKAEEEEQARGGLTKTHNFTKKQGRKQSNKSAQG